MSLESKDFTIHNAFSDCFYIIPAYQREYVWTDKQIQSLLEDIHEQFNPNVNNSKYFIGTILVTPVKEENFSVHFEVIDGQQRLTTIYLMLCVLRFLFKDKDTNSVINNLLTKNNVSQSGLNRTDMRLLPQYDNVLEVLKEIVEVDGDPKTIRAKIQSKGIENIGFGSIEKILNAYEQIYSFITENYSKKGFLNKYWGHIANNVVFIQIITDYNSALKTFETINERGIGLNPMDLLKNLLFSQVTNKKYFDINIKWSQTIVPLEKEKHKPLRFLRYFLMANYIIKNKRNESVINEDEIFNWISSKDNIQLTNYKENPIKFISLINKNVKNYINFSNGNGNDGKPNFAMTSLERLTGGAFSLHYVLLLAVANLPKHLFDQFVTQLESFLFYYIFTKTPTKNLDRNFSLWADELRVIVCMNNHISQCNALNNFIKNNFEKNMIIKKKELFDTMKRLSLHSMQKYRILYLLARLAQYVDMKLIGESKRGSIDEYIKPGIEIEHILPSNPKKELFELWKQMNPNMDYDEEKNRFGNLTLIEKPRNRSASNNSFQEKLKIYSASRLYLTRSIAKLDQGGVDNAINRLNAKLFTYPNWNVIDISSRQSMLITLADDIWKITKITI